MMMGGMLPGPMGAAAGLGAGMGMMGPMGNMMGGMGMRQQQIGAGIGQRMGGPQGNMMGQGHMGSQQQQLMGMQQPQQQPQQQQQSMSHGGLGMMAGGRAARPERGRSRSPERGRDKERSRGRSRSRSRDSKPDLLDMTYEEYMESYVRVKQKMEGTRDMRAKLQQQQQQQQPAAGAGQQALHHVVHLWPLQQCGGCWPAPDHLLQLWPHGRVAQPAGQEADADVWHRPPGCEQVAGSGPERCGQGRCIRLLASSGSGCFRCSAAQRGLQRAGPAPGAGRQQWTGGGAAPQRSPWQCTRRCGRACDAGERKRARRPWEGHADQLI
mmetsp:Transcript_29205/g.64555  ORF Transcript_29205/g.64555 Transcript_29205/m.64555 type:complete len:325 (-) Transcript_29205:1777-2751(-)